MARVLILGSTGMLGSMVELYFRRKTGHDVFSTIRGELTAGDASTGRANGAPPVFHFDAAQGLEPLGDILRTNDIEYIINCIGIIKPHCADDDPRGVLNAIRVNALFPHVLEELAGNRDIRIIQIATDCVYSGREGGYVESSPHDPLDVYGKTKSLGEVHKGRLLNIRCSIIGPERKGKLSLLEWILKQPEGSELNGFTHHRWNGVTTLQFARLCDEVISGGRFDDLRENGSRYHCVWNETVSKCELVSLVAEVFGRDLEIKPVDDVGPPVDRTLASERSGWTYSTPTQDMKSAIRELHDFTRSEGYYDDQ
jgi:dTDP-4-dehydrorhamnose reductase